MSEDVDLDHLSRISTIWTVVRQAHGERASQVNAAQQRLIDRYSGAVYRYLMAVLRDVDSADEVFQEFALRLVRGGFRNADQRRGRFRDYVKVSIIRLVTDHHRRRQRDAKRDAAIPVEADWEGPTSSPTAGAEDAFAASCREEFLGRAWRALRKSDEQTKQHLFAVLNYRSQRPDAPSQAVADELTRELQLAKPLTAAGVRKTLERARTRFADLLLEEVLQTLDSPTKETLEEELIDLGLHEYCGQALKRRNGDAQ